MKITLKKLTSMILALCLLLSLLPTAAVAAGDLPFRDIRKGAWYYDSVKYVYENDLMVGASANTFAPQAVLTRAMLVTVLWRMEGSPEAGNSSFRDAQHGKWYSAAVAWAEEKQIVMGYDAETFAPDDAITREQMVTMLYRYARFSNRDTSTAAELTAFGDGGKTSSWAREAMKWAVGVELIYGVGKGMLSPQGNATRAEFATILMRFIQNVQSASENTDPLANDKHLQYDKKNNVVFYDNRINVFVTRRLTSEEKKILADAVAGTIVGETDAGVFHLQILIPDATYDEICAKVEALQQYDFVVYAYYDIPVTVENSERLWDGAADLGNEAAPAGADWWAEAIGAYTAWQYTNECSPITVGIVDTGFDIGHKDLPSTIFFPSDFSENTPDDHGTHVAGIIAAQNNDFGMRGVIDTAKLACVDWNPKINTCLNIRETMNAIIKLVTSCNAKVINNSWNMTLSSRAQYYLEPSRMIDTIAWLLSKNDIAYENYVEAFRKSAEYSAEISAVCIHELIRNNPSKDFIITQSAGNGYDNAGPAYDLSQYGNYFCGITRELYNALNLNSGITYEDIASHIIIVGAAREERKQNKEGCPVYAATDFSNFGDQVDIIAPGDKIYSTVCGSKYAYQSGTSMAAPMVAGAAAFVWAIAPNLSAADVKEILLSNKTSFACGTVGSDSGRIYPMLNVGDAVKKAMDRRYAGTLSGKICKASDRNTPIANTNISIYKNEALWKEAAGNSDGSYSIALPVGEYKIVIEADGYLPFTAYATVAENENTYMETFLLVAGAEGNRGTATGQVVNALTGMGLEGVTLIARKGWNNTTEGAQLNLADQTKVNGEYRITLPFGNYTLELTKEGFISSYINIIVQDGITSSQNGAMSPVVSGSDYRIVLTWGKNPRDLDSHVFGELSDHSSFHVYYRHKSQYDNGVEVCNLDVDDTTSYGPETITLKTVKEQTYYYYIHHYAGSQHISTSGAQVRVYQGENLIATFNAPTDQGEDKYWNVFAITNGAIKICNTITATPDVGYACSLRQLASVADSQPKSQEASE